MLDSLPTRSQEIILTNMKQSASLTLGILKSLYPRADLDAVGEGLVAGRRWWAPWKVISEIRECPPLNTKTSMAVPLGGDDGDPGAPTTQRENVDGGTLGGDAGDPRAPTTQCENVNSGPLRGYDGDPGAPTTHHKNVNGGPPRRQCQRSGSAHHSTRKRRWWTPWEAMPEIRKLHQST
jgi:hypothetical protein